MFLSLVFLVQEEIVKRAFDESFLTGVVVVVIIANLSALVYAVRYSQRLVQKERDKNDDYRNKTETERRDDFRLLIEAQRSLEKFQQMEAQRGADRNETRRILEEIRAKVNSMVSQ